MSTEVTSEDIKKIQESIKCVLSKIDQFQLVKEDLLPEGLKPIARSMSWIIEQIVVQNLRHRGIKCGIESVTDPPHDLGQYDCVIKLVNDSKEYKVNVKTSLTSTSHNSRFDISKANKLITLYETEPNLILLVVIVKIKLGGLNVKFDDVIVFNVAWTPDIYYNRANHNLQSKCDGSQKIRSNTEFVNKLKQLMDDAGHSSHY